MGCNNNQEPKTTTKKAPGQAKIRSVKSSALLEPPIVGPDLDSHYVNPMLTSSKGKDKGVSATTDDAKEFDQSPPSYSDQAKPLPAKS